MMSKGNEDTRTIIKKYSVHFLCCFLTIIQVIYIIPFIRRNLGFLEFTTEQVMPISGSKSYI